VEPTDDSPQPAPVQSQRPLVNSGEEPRVVLAAVDTSAAAERVIAMAARFVRAFPDASLHVLHVLRFSRRDQAHAMVPALSSDVVDEAKDHLEHHKRLAMRKCRNVVTAHFAMGNPPNEILRFCSELKVDLLVIATHDHSGFERLLLGSIAETLVRKAPCSVTVVRQAIHGKR